MKRAPYMSRPELTSFLFVGAMAGQLKEIAKVTQEPDWRQKIKTAATYLCKITDERVGCLDREQILSVDRRRKGVDIVMMTEDAERYKEPVKELVQVDLDDLETLAEQALYVCTFCEHVGNEDAEGVKGCRYRQAYHRLGLTPAVDSPKSGQCEFVAR